MRKHAPRGIACESMLMICKSSLSAAVQQDLDSARKGADGQHAKACSKRDSMRKHAHDMKQPFGCCPMTTTHSKKSWYRPPHIYKDDTAYFITTSTVNKQRYFDINEKKDILSDVIQKACMKFDYKLFAWTILDNHYHILVEVNEGLIIPKFINNINANSSRILNTVEKHNGRHVWHQYFDRCIRSEKDYWTRFNYIHHNCIKHGYTQKMQDYNHSSYNQWLKEKGSEWMNDIFVSYPIVDFSVEGEVG